ncbi:MAG: hypothetical protein JXR61_10360 [Prolixibacteraceae bacterium]|nr:hypothetical protein [Prolixibacteraceae bacterium]
MKEFESNKDQHNLNSEFRKIHEFLHEFEAVFSNELQNIVVKNYSNVEFSEKLNESVLAYANEMISVAEAVCDKDLNYYEDRLKEELDTISLVVEKYPPANLDSEFLQQTHQKAKELIVNFYPHIFGLSSNGFRLLEKYCQMYNWKFVDIFHSIYNKK